MTAHSEMFNRISALTPAQLVLAYAALVDETISLFESDSNSTLFSFAALTADDKALRVEKLNELQAMTAEVEVRFSPTRTMGSKSKKSEIGIVLEDLADFMQTIRAANDEEGQDRSLSFDRVAPTIEKFYDALNKEQTKPENRQQRNPQA